METQNSTVVNRSDLKINGSGNTSGGNFNDVIINGAGEIKGDVDCVNFKSNGTTSMSGNLISKTVKVNGTASVKGNMKSDDIKINGSADISGSVESDITRIHGSVNINGNISSEELQLRGGMRVSGDCNAEKFESSGGFSVLGLLNAGNISIKLQAPCKAKEIGGENICVRKGNDFALKKLINTLFPSWDLSKKLTADLIEGNNIELESTRAKIVRGDNITIGDDCEIDLVEYRKSYNHSDKSTVKENKKV